jgi:hypothetical protein
MNVSVQPFFASLAEQLNRGATRAALGLLSFRSDPLREHLRRVFQSAPGTGDSFLAIPCLRLALAVASQRSLWQPLAGYFI